MRPESGSPIRPLGFDFGSELEGFDWVIGFAAVGSLVGALAGVWISARREDRSSDARVKVIG